MVIENEQYEKINQVSFVEKRMCVEFIYQKSYIL